MSYCKICFEEIKDNSLYNFTHLNSGICEKCFSNFKAKFINFNIGTIKALSIYEYDNNIQNLLFKFKGCYDIELAPVFLERYLTYLKLKFRGFHVVPIPSYYLDDEKRGFNHVVEIYNRLNFPMLKVLEKASATKQASKSKRKRMNTEKYFEIHEGESLTNKKILIVDDVYTTGSSIKAAIDLIRKYKPKEIRVLTIAKNIEKLTYKKQISESG